MSTGIFSLILRKSAMVERLLMAPNLTAVNKCQVLISTRAQPGKLLHTSNPVNKDDKPKVKMFYIPNPFKWFHNGMAFLKLRQLDPDFNIMDFKHGATQAVCTVIDFISRREWGELQGLLSQSSIDAFRSRHWTNDEIENLTIDPREVLVTSINSVQWNSDIDRKYCDIELLLMAVRQPHNPDKYLSIMLQFAARFHRDYTEGNLPSWTLTNLELHKFQPITRY